MDESRPSVNLQTAYRLDKNLIISDFNCFWIVPHFEFVKGLACQRQQQTCRVDEDRVHLLLWYISLFYQKLLKNRLSLNLFDQLCSCSNQRMRESKSLPYRLAIPTVYLSTTVNILSKR